MRLSLNRWWNDERGVTAPNSMILMIVIVVIGSLVGLSTLRDQIAQEFGDMAVAIDHLNQSYAVFVDIDGDGIFEPGDGDVMAGFADPDTLADPVGAPPACLVLTAAPAVEGSGLPALSTP